MSRRSLFLILTGVILLTLVATSFNVPASSPRNISAQDDDRVLTSVMVEEAPELDGITDEEFWADAPELQIEVKRGENESNTMVTLKSVYTEDMVYFVATYADPTQSYLRSPWEMQEDGTWLQLKDPEDIGGDNNLWYEDKLAFIWPIAPGITDFEEDGCFIACHEGETEEVKPYGNKYTEEEGEMGDIWHWKSVRNLNQLHDQYLDSTEYSEETKEAGRHSDPSESGGYVNNITEDKSGPAFMPAGEFTHDGAPGFILDSEKVEFDASLFEPGDRLPSIIISEFVGDGGDISAGWVWEEGVWTIEFGRKLVTESEFDVQFDDLANVYFFGVAVFDNTQVRHAYHRAPVTFVFAQ